VKYLVIDPGNSTGWLFYDTDKERLLGGTIKENFEEVAALFELCPNLVVIESFALYPGAAAQLSWSTFYPVEVIGVVKYLCGLKKIRLVEQRPSIKKFSGGLDARWIAEKKLNPHWTEHTKDCYLHLRYYLRNSLF
jgi:hypothetical protein